jgi:hypothetical protein
MTDIGEAVSLSVIMDEDVPVLRARVVEVKFLSKVKVAWQRSTVQGPHWADGADIEDNKYSKRPAAIVVRGSKAGGSLNVQNVEVKVQILESKKISGQGKLTGVLRDLTIEGDCPLGEGTHTLQARIQELPEGIQWFWGNMVWVLTVPSANHDFALNITRLEVFSVLDTPIPVFQDRKGVWAEALRFLCNRAGVINVTDNRDAAARVAAYCHRQHRLSYDSAGGGRSHYGAGQRGGTFQLESYLARQEEFANCYDQAAAIQTLSGALGVKLSWVFLNPYGFINITSLLGYGPCNNPFFRMNGSPQLVPRDDPQRTPFGNHAFCAFEPRILDACAGPHTGTESYQEYVDAGIDDVTTLYAGYQDLRPGRVEDMQWCSGVRDVA